MKADRGQEIEPSLKTCINCQLYQFRYGDELRGSMHTLEQENYYIGDAC
jgi:hypothetical protein